MYSIEQIYVFIKRYKIQLSLILIVMFALGIWLGLRFFQQEQEKPLNLVQAAPAIDSPPHKVKTNQNNKTTAQKIIVDIKGAVKHPNTYEMKSDDRIKQLLDKAEPLSTADLSRVNLAEKLVDQKLVYIPSQSETQTTQPNVSQASTMNSHVSQSQSQTINLNTADEKTLTQIPGIGPAKAQTIIQFRDEHGPFSTVDDLKKVKGIGQKTFEKLKPYFTV
ncbi:competence protein ComEA [Staphylococcus lutrae]|uniref:Competence protein ComEA n=2 Tax=Staphylococcus lutrae TaxID=155085 RepID=A0AAC9WKN2_9STAP|nr:competence protein ComEA [Staphylococcus lutrae]PNZ38639.1 competence protein ComEA [Staphylococcus lutrae]